MIFNNEKWVCTVQYEITMGKSGGGTNTVETSTSAPPPYVAAAYQALLAQGNQVAATPFSQPQQPVAGFTPDQSTAMNTIAGTQGMTQPYTNAGVAATQAGSQAIYPQLQQFNSQNLQQYLDPNTQNVINATMAQVNQNDAQQQSQLMGQAIQSGASPFGGDRAGVAAAALAGQQDLANNQTVAGLNSQNYTQALNELNNQQQLQANTQSSDAWRNLSAGQEYGALGTQAQGNTLNQASSQLQSGALQQQLAQEQLNAPYNEQLAQLAYPFQTTQFLGGLTEGIGSGSGGTGTSTSPGPSTLSQLGGLGLTGLALNQALPEGYGLGALLGGLKTGGVAGRRGHYDIGGVTLPYIPNSMVSIVPSATTQRAGNGPPQAPKPQTQQTPSASSDLLQGASLGKLSGGSSGSPSNPGGISPAASSIFGNNSGGSFGADTSMANQASNDANFMGNSSVDLSNLWKSGGAVGKYAMGGEILPILGDVAGAFFGDPMAGNQVQTVGDFFNLKKGGIAHHYDMGGQITTPQQAQLAGANPLVQQQYSQYANLPLDKLQQLAVAQPQNPMIQKALQMKKMGMSSGMSSQPATGVAAAGQIGGISTPMMAAGGRSHFDDGGVSDDDSDSRAMEVLQNVAEGDAPVDAPPPSPNAVGIAAANQLNGSENVNASDLLPPDAQGVAPPAVVTNTAPSAPPAPDGELDAKPVVDHSGDTVKLHSEGKVIDTGIPSMKDTGVTSSAWEPLLAAGLGMMAGRSPHALENIGAGGLEGLKVAMQQRQQAGEENKAQSEADWRKQTLQQELDINNKKYQQMTPYEQAQVDARNKELAQQEANNAALRAQGAWEIKPDAMGNLVRVNKVTGDVQKIQGSGFGGISPLGGASSDQKTDAAGLPTGDAVLTQLPSQIASQVKALAEGRMQFPSGFALKSPYWQQMISAVSQYDPTFDAVNYNSRAATRKDFTSGKDAQSINALNTVSEHLGKLQDAYNNLDNSSAPVWNSLTNWTGKQLGSNTKTNFDTVVGPVAEEMTKAYRGAGGNESDIQRVIGNLNSSMSPDQAKGAFNELGGLLKGKIDALQDQYKRGMGTAAEDKSFYTPDAVKAYKKIGLDLGDNAQQGSAAPVIAAPPAAAIQMLKQNPALAPAFQQKYGVSPQQYLGQ